MSDYTYINIALRKVFSNFLYFKKLHIDALPKFDRNSGKTRKGNRTNLDNIGTLTPR